MARHILRKKDIVKVAGKGNRKAQYRRGGTKRDGKIFRHYQTNGGATRLARHSDFFISPK